MSGLVCAHDGTCQQPRTEPGVGTAQAGDPCESTDNCDYGLVCGPEDTCIAGGIAAEGEGCGSTQDCLFGLVCGSNYVCTEPGDGAPGTACIGSEQCAAGLVCSGNGVCADPDSPDASGVGAPGEPCEETSDCRMGLACFLDGTCRAPEFWWGTDCSRTEADLQDDSFPFKVYFEVPEGTVDEFYRLPFPNDIRFRGGHIDLSGHPAPETPLASGLVTSYLDAIETEATGFSVQGSIYFRFSKAVDYDTIRLGGDNPTFYLVDITPDSPGYGQGGAVSMSATTARGKYICQHWMALKPSDGYPLRHATTYAVIVTDGIHASSGAALTRDEDFQVMLQDSEPTDPVMAAAWQQYQPLRDYLADESVVENGYTSHVMSAAVFTTMDPDALMEGFRSKFRECTGSDCDLLPAPDPVGTELDSETDDYYVVTGTIPVPVFQNGTPPYLSEGGGVEFESSRIPTIQRSENVDFFLTVPKGTPPAAGWPVVLFAHGTGGGADSFVNNGVADALSSVEVTLDSSPTTVGFAVLGIDGVQHGSRRGGSDLEPDVLYFNFLNPQAAKYNAVQGAADNFQLVRMVEGLASTPVSVTGVADPIQLDPESIHYFGHSQGCLTGPLFLAYEPMVKAVVLSGAGGNLIRSLRTKTKPVDIPSAMMLVLGDTSIGDNHPLLNLLQLYFDPVDVINYGRDLTVAPLQIGETADDPPLPIHAGPKHVFMSFGRDDSYSTEGTMISLARTLRPQQVNDLGLGCDCHDSSCDTKDDAGLHENLCLIRGIGETTTPVRANAWNTDVWYTNVLKMYMPDGYDGHFVLFDHPDGAQDYSRFLASAVADPEHIPTLFP
jgi:pimeloyl-ACP methyl ester carboxylesterase